jgi:aldose 1-epimerase
MKNLFTLTLLCTAFLGCSKPSSPTTSIQKLTMELYGTLPDGSEVSLFTLRNKNGMIAKVTEYGAILTSLEVPAKDGTVADVTHGYDTLEGWLTNTSYLGATVGRYGNRIAHGKFSLNDEDYVLATNNDPGGIPCSLHGGIKGFDKVLWSGKPFENADASGVVLTYVSKDGEEGFPGTLTAVVTYTLNDDNELLWEAKATVEGKSTPVNIVHHTYWNLSDDQSTSINDHHLTLHADRYLPTDAGLIPTGELAAVAGTPFDFNSPTTIGKRVETPNEQLKAAGGYDHCWVLGKLPEGSSTQAAATLHDPKSGRTMTVLTDQPGIQFYGGNFLDGSFTGKDGIAYPKRSACCLETQFFPDSPNQPDFPSCVLKPGETYSHTMVHRFSW